MKIVFLRRKIYLFILELLSGFQWCINVFLYCCIIVGIKNRNVIFVLVGCILFGVYFLYVYSKYEMYVYKKRNWFWFLFRQMCVLLDFVFRFCYKDGCLYRFLLIRDFNFLKMGFVCWDFLVQYLIVFFLFISVIFLVYVCEFEIIKS